MQGIKLEDITYTQRSLRKYQNAEERKTVKETIGMGQKIALQRNVIYNWKLNEVLEGIFELQFNFHEALCSHNLYGTFSHYQVQRNAEGIPVLVRVPE